MDRQRSFDLAMTLILVCGAAATLAPLYFVLTTASHPAAFFEQHRVPLLPGAELFANMAKAWTRAGLGVKLFNSAVVCLTVTAGKLILSTVTAYAFVYFRSPLRHVGFAAILLTLMLPLETRIAPTYAVAADALTPLRGLASLFGVPLHAHLTLLDTYMGLSLPIIATATGTFLFRQFYLTLPDDLVDAAKIEGAGPIQFFLDTVLPLSRGNLLALAIVTFIATWNQYLWPLLITTRPNMETAVLAVRGLMPDPQDAAPAWNITLAGVLIIGLVPVTITALFQRHFIRGLRMAGKDR